MKVYKKHIKVGTKCLYSEYLIRIHEIVKDRYLNSTERAIICYIIHTGNNSDIDKMAEDLVLDKVLLKDYLRRLRNDYFLKEDNSPIDTLTGYEDRAYLISIKYVGNDK